MLVSIICVVSCKYETVSDVVSCSTLTGATYSSNGGQIQSIMTSKCSGATCHVPGGEGAHHWVLGSYSSVSVVFTHCLETIENSEMPPSGSAKLTTDEKNKFEMLERSWVSSVKG